MQEITIKEKSVYGNVLLYPVCDKAVIFSNLVGKKTFTSNDVDLITALGYKVNIIPLP